MILYLLAGKNGVYDLWIECQRRVIFYKRRLYKVYTSRDEVMRLLYLPIWKRPDGFFAGLSSLTPINYGHEGKKQMEKCSSAMLMSVQNTHVIPTSLLRFSSILYINKCIIARYMIFGSLCIIGEYGGFQKLFGNVKKKKRRPSTNVAMFQHIATFGQQKLKSKSNSTS